MRLAAAAALVLLTACGAGSAPAPVAAPSSAHDAHPPVPPPVAGKASAPRPPRVRATTVPHLPSGVSRAVAVADGARLLVLGGLAPGDSTTGRVWSVDPASGSARVAGSLAMPVHDACGALVGGNPVVFGGGAAATTAAVQEWRSGSSRVVARLPQPRSDSSCATLNGTTYIAGGFDGHRMLTDVLATTDARHFRVVAHLRQGVRYAAVAAVGHWVVVIGGALATTEGTSTGAQSDLIQRVDVDTGRVDVPAHLPEPIAHATAVTLDDKILVIGGRHGTAATADVAWVYPTAFMRVIGRLPHALSDAAVAVVGHTAVVLGGESSGPMAPLDTVTMLTLAA